MSESLGIIVGLILAHSVYIGSELEENELLVPIVIYYQDGKRKIEVFEADTQEDAVDKANKYLDAMPESIERWAYVQEGLITLKDGRKQDVYFIKAWVKGMHEPMQLYQMYNSNPFALIDTIQVLNYDATGLKSEHESLFASSLYKGIFLHPSAPKDKLEQWFK